MNTFLRSGVCDVYFSYAGCSNLVELRDINLVFAWIFGSISFFSLAYPLRRLYEFLQEKKPLSRIFNNIHMKISVLYHLSSLIKTTAIINARSVSQDTLMQMPDRELQAIVSWNILLEASYYFLNGICMSMYSAHLIGASSGMHSSEYTSKFVVWTKNTISFVLLFIFALVFILLASWGVQSNLVTYIILRRCGYLISSICFIAEAIFLVISRNAIKKALNNSKNVKKDVAKKIRRTNSTINTNIFYQLLPNALYCIAIEVSFEMLQGNPTALFYSKIILFSINTFTAASPTWGYLISVLRKVVGRNSSYDSSGCPKEPKLNIADRTGFGNKITQKYPLGRSGKEHEELKTTSSRIENTN